ncbi:putative ABC transporter ATP-binding protein YheS [invertebrate metagenome]|uniref:Putative ABC transporter ATP-binding protein YheS n=1 Tax=invertebrate metagenome TaxID=1711999 RepID=A0A2H9TBW3_9ZZZZ
MHNMITLSAVSLIRAGKTLLNNVSLSIPLGHHVGLVGRNGCGKSSLMALLTGELQPDNGEVTIDAGLVQAHMAQEIDVKDQTAMDYVLDGDQRLRKIQRAIALAEQEGAHEKLAIYHEQLLTAGGYTANSRVEQLFYGLGFPADAATRSVKDFSGGWRMRLGLARTLTSSSDILLLDEPTNHLDLDAIIWLEGYLKKYQGTLIIISHDRDFLDAITNWTLHIEHGNLQRCKGNYSAFEVARAEQLRHRESALNKQRVKREHLEEFVRRFRAKANKAKQAQSRLKALAKLEDISGAHLDSPFAFEFPADDKISSPLLTMQEGSLGYDNKTVLAADLYILPGQRIGLLGANGAGKSTLMKTLAGHLPLLDGKLKWGDNLRIGYFAQHQLEALDNTETPLTHLKHLAPDIREQELRSFLGGFGFMGNQVNETVARFSGGERARLALAIIAWNRPNLLLLDEPTNHLDLDMRHALTIALQSFEGAMILVSHDRSLLRSTTDHLFLVHDGCFDPFYGDLEDYSEWLQKSRIQARKPDKLKTREKVKLPENSAQAKKEQKRVEAKKRKALSPLRNKIKSVEKELDANNQALADIKTQLSDPQMYAILEAGQLHKLTARQSSLEKEQDIIEEQWLALQEELESLQE